MAEEERVGASGEKSFEDAGDVAPMEVDRSGNGDSGHDRDSGPSRENILEVLSSLSSKWREVAGKVGFGLEEVEKIEEECNGKEDLDHLAHLVSKWLNLGPVGWSKVMEVMEVMGLKEEATQLANRKGVARAERGEEEIGPPNFTTQKVEGQAALQQTLKKGDTWYLVDMRWMKQWKKFVGYDQWDQGQAGQSAANPGPIDNSNLFKESSPGVLKEHLMEELDYYLLPEPAWNKLYSWYDLGPRSRPLARRVVEHGMYMKHCKVEVYLMEFKLSIHPRYDQVTSKPFSKGDSVGDLEKVLREIYEVKDETKCRVWHRYLTNSYELLSDPSQTLQDAGLYSGQTVVLECCKEDGTWPRSVHTTTSGQNPTRSTDEQFSSSSSSSSASQTKSSSSNSYGGGGSYYGSSYSSKPTSPGLCGLSNLGNTCFMNSALQCLSNTSSLTKYFIGTKSGYKPYKKHINKDNPLGMGGAIAEAYGALLEDMWSGKVGCVAPRQFKTQVGRYAPQFVGYAQHDSQELLAFLLDGLHEDLNLVRKKPYVDMSIETKGREDKGIAEETWLKYLERNQSVIVRSFQGQLKSTLVCPVCETLSKTFDPFMFLSLPLPIKKIRSITVNLVPQDSDALPTTFKLMVPKRGVVADLKLELCKLSGVATAQMVVTDVYNSRFHRMYSDKDSLNLILDRDDIYVYELPPEQNDIFSVCVYFREETVRDVRYSSSSYTQRYHQLFGIPMVVSVPSECKYSDIYQAIYNRGRRFIKSWAQVKGESQDQSDWPQEDKESSQGDKEGSANRDEETNSCEKNDPATMEDEEEKPSGEAEEKEENNNTEKKEDKEKEVGEDVEMKEVEEKNDDEYLYKLVIVNSYGSQEMQQLDMQKTYTFSKSVYLACDWRSEVKEKCYDEEKAQEFLRHESCDMKEAAKKNIHLMDCMQLFTQKEVLSRDDAWYCPQCKDFVQATKKFDLWKTPDVLVIHLKRFSYDRYWRDKLDVLVDFPIKGFDLSELVECRGEPQPIYDLYAISNHFGGMGGGHYTAFAKYRDSSTWYNYDDSHVSQISEDKLVSSSAYVLFYERRVEGRRVPAVLDRSLSQSFAEEKLRLANKYKTDPKTTVQEELPEEEVDNSEVFSNENDLEQPD